MKTFKITLIAVALFFSNGLFAQGKSAGRGKAHVTKPVNVAGINNREQARVNGSVNANAHASEIAKTRANSNSVLNPGYPTNTPRVRKKHHRKHHRKAHK